MKKNGTGGANTNFAGLAFEEKTKLSEQVRIDLADRYELRAHSFPSGISSKSTAECWDVVDLKTGKLIGIIAEQMQFYNVLDEVYQLKNNNRKNWKPDESFFNLETETVFIVEKKWQETSGSTDEKVFGFVNKRRLYQKIFNQKEGEPKIPVQFVALFNSSWWLDPKNKYADYFDNLRDDGIKIMFDKYEFWWFGL